MTIAALQFAAEKLVDEVRAHEWSGKHGGSFDFDLSFNDAVALVAAQLQIIREQGVLGGLEEARKIVGGQS